jgi:hypothetical protein
MCTDRINLGVELAQLTGHYQKNSKTIAQPHEHGKYRPLEQSDVERRQNLQNSRDNVLCSANGVRRGTALLLPARRKKEPP